MVGVCKKTLQNWSKLNKIKFIVTEGGWRKYDVDEYLNRNNLHEKIKICYCRVSSYDKKEDLSRQIIYLTKKYPDHEIIKDIGSGINFKRLHLLIDKLYKVIQSYTKLYISMLFL
jgi:putative resolvase